jgi:hypothetical protein
MLVLSDKPNRAGFLFPSSEDGRCSSRNMFSGYLEIVTMGKVQKPNDSGQKPVPQEIIFRRSHFSLVHTTKYVF